MEWFFSIFDKIAASYIWKTLFSHFGWVDWFTAGMIIIGLVYGSQNGMMREVVEIMETIVLVFIVLHYYPELVKMMQLHFNKLPPAATAVFVYILISAAVWTVIYFIDKHFRKLVKAEAPKLIKVGGGALLGMTHTVILWSFLSQMIVMTPARPVRRAYEKGNSVTGHAVLTLAPRIHDFLADPMKAMGKKKKT